MASLYVSNSTCGIAARIIARLAGVAVNIQAADASNKCPTLVGESTITGADAVSRQLARSASDKAVVAALLGANPAEEAAVSQWSTFAYTELPADKSIKEILPSLHALNSHLSSRVYTVGTHVSVADVALYVNLHSIVAKLSDEEKVALCNIARFFDFVQNQSAVRIEASSHLPKLSVSVETPFVPQTFKKVEAAPAAPSKEAAAPAKAAEAKKAEIAPAPAAAAPSAPVAAAPAPAAKEDKKEKKERPAKPEGAPAEGGEKKEKKEKEKKEKAPAAPPAPVAEPDISAFDIRVGKIVKVERHPNADSLYLEQIECGEDKPRQVVSGLVKFIPIEEMQDRTVLILANLKASKMRGVESQAMVLCASDAEHTKVDFVIPPSSKPGERVTFPGFSGAPMKELKKEVLEKILVDLKTNAAGVAVYKDAPFTVEGGVCTASIPNGNVR